MRQGSNGRRPRGRPNRKQHGGSPRPNNFDSNGPEGRVRGNAHQVYEKYIALARDATSAGDRIGAETYLQHAEHYFRILNASTDPASEYRGPGARQGGNGRAQDGPWTQPGQGRPGSMPQPDDGGFGPIPAAPVARPDAQSGAEDEPVRGGDGQGRDDAQMSLQPRRRPRRAAPPAGDPATQEQPVIDPAPAGQSEPGADPETVADGG